MRLLIITYRLPTDLCSGDQYTIHNMLKHFSKDHEITLAAFVTSHAQSKELGAVAPYCKRIELVLLSKWQSYWNVMVGLLSSLPLQVCYYGSRKMRNKVQQLIEEENIDVAYCYHLRSGQYLSTTLRCPRVLDLKPVQSLNLRRMKNHVTNPLKRLIYQLEYKRTRKYEPELIDKFDQCLVISDTDLKEVDPTSSLKNIMINPHGLDTEQFAPSENSVKEPGSIIFSGKMNYDPNIDAAIFFCKEIFPLIQTRVPDVKLYIVGIDPTPEIKALANDPAIIVTGWVEDIREYMSRVQVAIDPLRIGAGLQNKVLENMSMGIPMVVTSIANEGIKAKHAEHLLVADTPADFAEQTIRLLDDSELRDRLGGMARTFITNNWTWEKHFQDLEHLFFRLSGTQATNSATTPTTPVLGRDMG